MRVLLGGRPIAVADGGEIDGSVQSTNHVILQFHGGRSLWMVDHERVAAEKIFPRDEAYGTLPEMMRLFEKKTGIELDPVRIAHLGRGVSIYSSKGEEFDSNNPYRLNPGEKYQTVIRGEMRVFEAVQMKHGIEIAFVDREESLGETFPPLVILDAEAWGRMTPAGVRTAEQDVECGPKEVERPRG